MNHKLFRSYFPDLQEQLLSLQKEYSHIYDQLKKIKEEEKKRAKDLSTAELVQFYQKAAW